MGGGENPGKVAVSEHKVPRVWKDKTCAVKGQLFNCTLIGMALAIGWEHVPPFGFLAKPVGTGPAAQGHCAEEGWRPMGSLWRSRHQQTHFPVPAHIVALAAPHQLGTKGRSAGLGQAGGSPWGSTGCVSRKFHPGD